MVRVCVCVYVCVCVCLCVHLGGWRAGGIFSSALLWAVIGQNLALVLLFLHIFDGPCANSVV